MEEEKKMEDKMPAGSQDNMGTADPKDVEENKAISVLSYIGILVLIPLLAKKDSRYAQFHAKQGLVIFIAQIILSVIFIIPFLGWIIWLIGWIILVILSIMGIINALGGKMKELPITGQYADKIMK